MFSSSIRMVSLGTWWPKKHHISIWGLFCRLKSIFDKRKLMKSLVPWIVANNQSNYTIQDLLFSRSQLLKKGKIIVLCIINTPLSYLPVIHTVLGRQLPLRPAMQVSTFHIHVSYCFPIDVMHHMLVLNVRKASFYSSVANPKLGLCSFWPIGINFTK